MTLYALSLLAVLPIQVLSPVSLEVLFDGVPARGGGWVLTVTLFAEEDVDECEVRFTHSDGLSISSGESYWKGRIEAESEVVFEIAYILMLDPPQHIAIDIIGHTATGLPFKKRMQRNIPKH